MVNSTDICEAPNNKIYVYPNPTQGSFYVVTDLEVKINLINLLGETVLERRLTNSNNKIDISDYPKGVYYLEVLGNNILTTKKIVLE